MSEAPIDQTTYVDGTHQFLTFALGQEEYGVEILNIQEIKGFSAITPLPNAPVFVKGVLNLRGTIVPIVDRRKKFGLPDVELTKFTVIVVVQIKSQANGQNRTMGFIVDAVSDVLNVAGNDIQPTPELHGQGDTAFSNGQARAAVRTQEHTPEPPSTLNIV